MSKNLGACILVLALLSGAAAFAGGPRITSSPGIAPGVGSHDGFTIAPARGTPPRVYTEDLAPAQVFEVMRPEQRPFSVGRIIASCTCLGVSMDKADFGPGERALIEVRNVKPTQPDGATYAFFVEITHPFRQILQYDVFVKSERRPPPAPPARSPQAHRPEPPRQPDSRPPVGQPEPPRRPEPGPSPQRR